MLNSYQPNIDNMKQYLSQENEKSSGGNGPTWWSIPAGMSSVRILPPWDPTGRVALPVYMHPIEYKGEGMSYTKYNWTCVNKTFNKPCAICEGLANLAAAGVDISNWDANRRQFYFNAIVMHDPTYNQQTGKGIAPGTHVLMKAPKTFYDWVIAQITNPMIGDITNVQNGIDVYVTKEGQGLGTTYNMTLSPNGRTPIPEEYLNKIENLYNLDDIFSSGFEQKQIDELVNHLKKSAGVMASGMTNAVNQMAGYPTPPIGAPNPQPSMYNPAMAPNQFNSAPQQIPSTPNPYVQSASTPQAPGNFSQPASTQSTMTSPSNLQVSSASNVPKCFGNYDAGNVNCVVCPAEVACSQKKQ